MTPLAAILYGIAWLNCVLASLFLIPPISGLNTHARFVLSLSAYPSNTFLSCWFFFSLFPTPNSRIEQVSALFWNWLPGMARAGRFVPVCAEVSRLVLSLCCPHVDTCWFPYQCVSFVCPSESPVFLYGRVPLILLLACMCKVCVSSHFVTANHRRSMGFNCWHRLCAPSNTTFVMYGFLVLPLRHQIARLLSPVLAYFFVLSSVSDGTAYQPVSFLSHLGCFAFSHFLLLPFFSLQPRQFSTLPRSFHFVPAWIAPCFVPRSSFYLRLKTTCITCSMLR